MKLYKVAIQENKRLLPTGEIQYDEATVQIYEQLDREQKTYVMKEYSREQKSLLRIGVKIAEADHVIAKDAWGNEFNLFESIHEKDLWYDVRKGWMENGYETTKEAIFGSNACGEWKILAYRKDRSLLASEDVRVIPSLLSAEQYRIMQLEIKKLFEELVYQPGQNDDRNIIRELQVPLFPIENLQILMSEWARWLEQIEESPSEILYSTRDKRAVRQLKRWDAKAILEQALFPFRDKISARVSLKDVHVPEHRMIKWMLERVNDRIEQEKTTEASMLHQLKEIRHGIVGLKSSHEKDNKVLETLEKRKQQIKKDIDLLEDRYVIWTQFEAVINHYLTNEIFNVGELEPEWTHLFASHPQYRAVYEVYERIGMLAPILTLKELEFEKSLTNSPHLYEVWVLLQLIRELNRVKFVCKDVAESLISHFEKKRTLSGWRDMFTYEDKVVWLYYECELPHESGKLVKPDYLLLFKTQESDLWHAHTLDAKYKPYVDMGKKVLEHDLERSGRRYLGISKNKIVMKSASVVHMDKRTNNWNVDTRKLYSLCHFHAIPGNLEGLKIYMKRFFHYFENLKHLCPSCGEIATCRDQNFKQTYICDFCNEVWVNNTCRDLNRQHVKTKVRLLKYASGNYYLQVGDDWNVYCPICSSDVNGHIVKTDLFGEKITH
ncbi:hypothetical protein ABEW19_28135 [Paenibacillus illinoisensis]|uniref:hypothetical protein n=1 Tax=Paenibacillus illinoisensis TaxID=59845 RepID=UPI003D26D342